MAGTETSRQAVQKVLSGDRATFSPFLPWVCIHAAKLEQVPLKTMLNDPSRLTRSLENAQKLYGYDMVVNVFDPVIEAEACGCPVRWPGDRELPVLESHPPIDHLSEGDISNIMSKGRLPVVIEATKRLKITLGRTVAIAGLVTGPFTLASHLKGQNIAVALDRDSESAKNAVELAEKICIEVCKAYCELEVDVIVLAESVLPQLPERYVSLSLSTLRPLINIIRFYNGLSLLLASGCSINSADFLANTETDGMVVDAPIEEEVRKKVDRCIVGRTIPSSVLEGPKEPLTTQINSLLKNPREAGFLSTDWQVPYDTPPENIHQLMKYIKEA